MLEILAVVALAAACLWAVAAPLTRNSGGAQPTGAPTGATEAAKEAKYREIRDAQADRQSGKLTESEWRSVDADLRAEAIEILGDDPGFEPPSK